MAITFAGIPLLLEDPEGQAAAFVKRYLEWPHSTVNAPARTIDSKSRVQRPKWPEQPKLKPNQLYWPTGATRWGQFIGLATEDAKNQILSLASGGIGTLVVQIDGSPDVSVTGNAFDGDPFSLNSSSSTALLSTLMYLLPPQPVSISPQSLWIIPLVDARYWWQTAMFVSSMATWSGLLGEIQAALPAEDSLSITLKRDTTDVIDRNYGIPDACIFRNGAINAAAALDLLCWATNQRLVVKNIGEDAPSQRYVLRSSVTCDGLYTTERDAQLSSVAKSSAGGDWGVNNIWMPSTAYVAGVFAINGGNLYLCLTPGTSASSGGPTGTTTSTDGTCTWVYVGPANVNGDVPKKIQFHFTNDGSTEVLKYTGGTAVSWADGQTLDVMCPATLSGGNDVTLKSMADKWANDLWKWSKWRFAWSFNYLLDWHFTGYEDFALLDLSRNGSRYQARTFIKSLPPTGWGMDVVPLQVVGGGNDCGGGGFPLVRFQITDPDCSEGEAQAVVTAVSCNADAPRIGDAITVYDLDGWFSGENNTSLMARTGTAHKFNLPPDNDDDDSDIYSGCSYVILILAGGSLTC